MQVPDWLNSSSSLKLIHDINSTIYILLLTIISECSRKSCEACGNVFRCNSLQDWFCKGCKTPLECAECHEFSSSERTRACSACKKVFCNMCVEACNGEAGCVGMDCELCKKSFCDSCRDIGQVWWRSCCRSAFCVECRPVVECHHCEFFCDSIPCRKEHEMYCDSATPPKKTKT